MRRLSLSVAVLAAVLLAPGSALAVGQPVVSTAPYANGPRLLTWTDVPDALTYQVMRGTGNCSNAQPVSGGLVAAPALAYTDSESLTEDVYCYVVQAQGLTVPLTNDSLPVPMTFDVTAPVITGVTETGTDGCTPGAPFTITAASATDASPVAFAVNGTPMPPDYVVAGQPFDLVSPTVTATDAAGNPATAPFAAPAGRVNDPTPPGPVSLEVATDPTQRKVTLNWDPPVVDGAPVSYRVRTKGPQGPGTNLNVNPPLAFFNLQVDATYEYALDAVDACNRVSTSVRLVRLNDTTPPSEPIVAGPSFNPATHAVSLSWVASTDNIQVDHYVVLRDGVPLGATDATVFTDLVPPQHARLNYVVRALDTNGNATDSAPAPISTPDWTPPTPPLPTLTVSGTTATLRWPPSADNVGVVGYDVLRDDKQIASMTAVVRSYRDVGVPPGVHTWRVRSRDDAGLVGLSGPQPYKIEKATARARVLSLRMVGGGKGAARYALKARGRLLVDLRVVGTLPKARLRLYVSGGRGRITIWRGTPGSSAPKLRLGSALARRGFVTIKLRRTLHAGRIRLVLVAGSRVEVVAKGAHRPVITSG